MYPSHTRMNTCRSFRTACAFPTRSILISSYQAQQMCQKCGLISAKLSPGLCLSVRSPRGTTEWLKERVPDVLKFDLW